MAPKIKEELAVRDQLITGLKREIELQRKIIREQETTINALEEQLEEFHQLMKDMLDFNRED